MSLPSGSISSKEYFRVDFTDRIPSEEYRRRDAVKRRLEAQIWHWRQHEEGGTQNSLTHLSLHIIFINSTGWNETNIFKTLSAISPNFFRSCEDGFFKQPVNLYRLAELFLCSARAQIVRGISAEEWLYDECCRYALLIEDFGQERTQYRAPLIQLAAKCSDDTVSFQTCSQNEVSSRLPQNIGQALHGKFRIIRFPQTRYSFIENEVLPIALFPD
jgi:hypothetical protein